MSPAVDQELAVTLADIRFNTPVLNASGAFNPALFSEMYLLKQALGAIVTKTVTQEPKVGNMQPRTVELPGIGMLNSIGLQNPGLASFLEVESVELAQHQVPLVLSISADSNQAFAEMAEAVMAHPNGSHVAAIEVNLSCPNVEKGGVEFCSQPQMVLEAVQSVCSAFHRPVFAKLTPNTADIVPIAAAAIEGGASALTAINTVYGAAVDIKTRTPILKRVSGGYSGPGIKPIALHHIWRLYHHFPDTPIIGVGGIASVEDVLEFMMAGASLVQVGTACFREPMLFQELVVGLQRFCQEEGITSLSDLTGCAHRLG